MPSAFAITPAASTLRLDAQGRGELSFTVTNTSGRPLRGRAKVQAQDPSQQAWFRLDGEPERNFAADKSTDQFVVKVNAPPNTPPGKAVMHLDMSSVENPDEVFTIGPMVSCELIRQDVVKKKIPWWVYAVGAGVVVLLIAVLLLTRTAKVPNVVNMSFADAQKELEAAGMKLGQTNQKSTGKPAGTVLAQTPAAGEAMPDHKIINLDVEQEPPHDVAVPAIVGLSLTDAQDKLTKASLKPGKFTYDLNSPGKPNFVLDQNPRKDIRVPFDTEVDLVVKGDSVPVPALVGNSLQNAVIQLQNMDLQMALSEQVIDARIKAPGTIVAQNPAPQIMVARKSTIAMTVAKAPNVVISYNPVFYERLNAQSKMSLQSISSGRALAPQK